MILKYLNKTMLISSSTCIYYFTSLFFVLSFQLALRLHPDKNQGDDEATEKV